MSKLSILRTELLFLAAVVLVGLVADFSFIGFLPLFSLCAGSGGTGGSGSGSGASGEGADMGSTPFLYVWRDGAFHIENDVMVAKPPGLYPSKIIGRRAYEAGRVGQDLYLIQNAQERVGDKLKFQIRELEPEESFIDHFSLLRVVYPQNRRLFVNALEGQLLSFDTDTLARGEGIRDFSVRDLLSDRDVTRRLSVIKANAQKAQPDAFGHSMTKGAQLGITAKVVERHKPLYLFIESNFRDWTAGEIMEFKQQPTLYAFLRSTLHEDAPLLRKTLRAATAVGIFALFSVANFATGTGSVNNKDSQAGDVSLFQTWGVPQAHADSRNSCSASSDSSTGCNSLRVEYWNGSEYRLLDIISPRYYRPAFEALRLSEDAVSDTGDVQVRITATARHNVTSVGLIAHDPHEVNDIQEFKVVSAKHQRDGKEYSRVLSTPHSGEYMRTIPADLVEVEVDMKGARNLAKDEEESFLVKVGGHYNPASAQVQREAAGLQESWLTKLDPEAQDWVKKMYVLRQFRSDV